MSDAKKTEVPATTTPEPATPEISNADVKGHELFQKITAELGALRNEKAERAAADEKATKDAELKKAAEEGRFEDALKQRDTELEKLKADYARDILNRDLQNEMLKAGFQNGMFISGAVAGYNTEMGSIVEYVDGLAKDEVNKAFLGHADTGRNPPPPPGKPAVNGGKVPNWDEVKSWETGTDPEKKKQARELISAYRKEHDEYPYKL